MKTESSQNLDKTGQLAIRGQHNNLSTYTCDYTMMEWLLTELIDSPIHESEGANRSSVVHLSLSACLVLIAFELVLERFSDVTLYAKM